MQAHKRSCNRHPSISRKTHAVTSPSCLYCTIHGTFLTSTSALEEQAPRSIPLTNARSGSVTEGIWGNGQCNTFPGSTTGNVCTSQPARSVDGKEVVGATIFVKTDCGTNARLPMDQQDPAYQHDGVAMPQSAFISTYQTCNCNEDGCDADSPSCCANGSCPVGSNVVGGGERKV